MENLNRGGEIPPGTLAFEGRKYPLIWMSAQTKEIEYAGGWGYGNTFSETRKKLKISGSGHLIDSGGNLIPFKLESDEVQGVSADRWMPVTIKQVFDFDYTDETAFADALGELITADIADAAENPGRPTGIYHRENFSRVSESGIITINLTDLYATLRGYLVERGLVPEEDGQLRLPT